MNEVYEPQPLDMVLHCPKCGTQHVDERTSGWVNPPHRSHLCHACQTIWRPADVPTNGVREVKTRGKVDTWPSGVPACGVVVDHALPVTPVVDHEASNVIHNAAGVPASDRGKR